MKEPRVTRFDPADRPIFSVAVTNDAEKSRYTIRELTTIADQLVKKRLENVRGVGSISLVGGVKREIQIYVKPAEMQALIDAQEKHHALRQSWLLFQQGDDHSRRLTQMFHRRLMVAVHAW